MRTAEQHHLGVHEIGKGFGLNLGSTEEVCNYISTGVERTSHMNEWRFWHAPSRLSMPEDESRCSRKTRPKSIE